MKRGGLICFFRVSERGVKRGVYHYLVLVSSSVQGDRGETSLGSGLRDGVDYRVDGGAFRCRDRERSRRRWGQAGRRGR